MSLSFNNMSDPIWTTPNGTVYLAGGSNANCTVSVCPVDLSVYGYRPSIGESSALIALYAVCMVFQTILGWRYKTWGFMAAMLLGCIDEILGYVGRILLWQNPWNHAGFIMQIVLITIGPVFFSAAIYVLLYQIVTYISVKHSRFPPNVFYYTFIPCDIISLILQAVGGAMSSTSNGSSNVGVNIALAGLAFQVATLAIFILLTVDYFIRSRSVWRSSDIHLPRQFKIFVGFIAIAAILILIRCSYRVYELSEGYSRTSKSLRDQGLFIGLESIMVILSAYALIVAHPGPVFSKGGYKRSVNDEKVAQSSEGNQTTDNSTRSPNSQQMV